LSLGLPLCVSQRDAGSRIALGSTCFSPDTLIALLKKPSTSSRTFWAQTAAKEQSAGAIGKHEQCAMGGLGPADLAYAFAAMKPLNRLNRIHLQVP
jgi:hypothetical protein